MSYKVSAVIADFPITAKGANGHEAERTLFRKSPRAEPCMFKRVDHIALHVPNAEDAAAFYESVLGFKRYFGHPSSRGEPILYLRLGDMVLELTQHTPAEPMSGFHLCLETDDIVAASAKLTAAGIAVLQAARPTVPRTPAEADWQRAVFRGPCGEMIELRGRARG